MDKKFYVAWLLVYGIFIALTHYNCYYSSLFAILLWGLIVIGLFTSHLRSFYNIVFKKAFIHQKHIEESFMEVVPVLGSYGLILALNGSKSFLAISSCILFSKIIQLFGLWIGVRKCQTSL